MYLFIYLFVLKLGSSEKLLPLRTSEHMKMLE